jgi:hypothetical protein
MNTTWLEGFIEERKAWLEGAAAQGVPADFIRFGECQLQLLVAAKATADAEVFSVEEVANVTGLHVGTIRRKARKGEFGPREDRSHIQLTRSDIAKLGSRNTRPTRTLSLVDHFTGPSR